jgi:hypothetical protein
MLKQVGEKYVDVAFHMFHIMNKAHLAWLWFSTMALK